MSVHRMPSSSEDLTLARITSPVKGRKTTKRKMTSVEQSEWVGMSVETSRGSSAPLYQKHPSPYRTFPSPTGTRADSVAEVRKYRHGRQHIHSDSSDRSLSRSPAVSARALARPGAKYGHDGERSVLDESDDESTSQSAINPDHSHAATVPETVQAAQDANYVQWQQHHTCTARKLYET